MSTAPQPQADEIDEVIARGDTATAALFGLAADLTADESPEVRRMGLAIQRLAVHVGSAFLEYHRVLTLALLRQHE